MAVLLIVPIVAPLIASIATLILGWRRLAVVLIVLSAATVLGCGVALGACVDSTAHSVLSGLLRVDALTAVMLIVIGAVGTLAAWASAGYIATEIVHGHTDSRGARLYGVLMPLFLAAMVLAVCANKQLGS